MNRRTGGLQLKTSFPVPIFPLSQPTQLSRAVQNLTDLQIVTTNKQGEIHHAGPHPACGKPLVPDSGLFQFANKMALSCHSRNERESRIIHGFRVALRLPGMTGFVDLLSAIPEVALRLPGMTSWLHVRINTLPE
jgi:hypothetical protein